MGKDVTFRPRRASYQANEVNTAAVDRLKSTGQESRHGQAWLQLYRYVYARVRNREEAEDLTQEAYSRALAGGRTEEARQAGEPPSPWYLQTVALNLIRDRWRRHRARGVEVPLEETLLQRPDDTEGTVFRTWVRGLMAQLPEEQRTVLELRLVAGHSRAETAHRMGKSEDAVRGLQYRAVQTMRRLMLRQSEEDSR